MEAVPVSEFLKFSFEELNDGCHKSMNVLFSDGVLQLSPNEIKFNRIVWDVFNTITNIPICKRHSISEHYVQGIFTGGSFLKLMEAIFRDVIDICCKPTYSRQILNDYLFEKFQSIYNEVYNKIACRRLEYCTGLDVLDFMEVQFRPKMLEAMKRMDTDKSEEAINNAYDVLDQVIREDEELKNSIVRKGYVSKNFNPNQVKQILGPRGYIGDLNSNLFPEPVTSSLLFGLRSNYELAIESRTAAKALHVSHQSIEQSEYLARTLQIITMRMQRLVDGDCGSTEYFEWYLDPDPVIGKSELGLLVGKHYLDEETNTLKTISADDKHLIGKTLKLRSPIHCKHKDQKCICVACLGELSYSIPYPTNIGHMAATEFTEKISQSILSTKHLTSSAKSIDFDLGPVESIYFNKVENEGLKLNIKNYDTKKYKYELLIEQNQFKGLNGIVSGTNVERLVSGKISRISYVTMRVTDRKGLEKYDVLQISFSKNIMNKKSTSHSSQVYGYLGTDFLKYVIDGLDGESVCSLQDGTDNYVINLNPWIDRCSKEKESLKVVEFPKLEYNFLQLTKEVRGSVSMKGIESLGGSDSSLENFIQNLFNLLNHKLDINLGLIEIVGCAFTVMSKEKGDAHVGRGVSSELASIPEIISNISLGASYGFERHRTSLLTPLTFLNNYVNHLLDVLVMPEETLTDVSHGGRYG